MIAKKLLALLVVTVFSLSLASPGISAGAGQEAKGTVTKIEGGNVTISDATGAEKTVVPKNPEALKDLEVGDQVVVKDDVLTKKGGAGRSAPSPGQKY